MTCRVNLLMKSKTPETEIMINTPSLFSSAPSAHTERKKRSHYQMNEAKPTPLSVPVGYRFHPTEEELVNHYLKKKMQGDDSEINNIIPEIDVCKYEPTELPALLGTETEDSDDMEWFFFTRKDYKYNNSARSNRSTKQGYWKITAKERGIKARRSKTVIGKKRTLTFYQGRMPNSKKTNWVIHEYYLPVTESISYQKQAQGDFVICRLKNKSDKKDSSICDEGEPGTSHVASNSENEAAGDMLLEAQENGESLFHQPQLPLDDCCSALQSPTSLELEDVLQANGTNGDCNELQSLQSSFGDNDSCFCDKNVVLTCDEDETVYDMFPELCDQPARNLDSLFRPLQLQDYRPSIPQSPIYTKLGNVPHQLHPKDYQAPILQSPIYTKLGNVPHANVYYGECNKLQSAFKKKNSTNEVDIPVRHIVSNFENQATDYRTQEVNPQAERNMESSFYPLQPQDYTLHTQPLMYTKFEDALHNIERNELQSRFGDNDFYHKVLEYKFC